MKQKIKNVIFDTKAIDDTGVVIGYLNTFDTKDHADDVTVKGAFTKSINDIKQSGRDLPMLFSHDEEKPVGIWKNLREDSNGLIGEGHVNLQTQRGREVYELAKQGALTGISIGYFIVEDEYDRFTDTTYLKQIDLMEASLCVFPCNETSRVETVKMKLKNNELPTVRELEKHLKDTGLSASEAKTICSKYMPDYVDEAEAARKAQEEMEAEIAQAKEIAEKYGLEMKAPVADEPRDDVVADDMDEKGEDEEDKPEFKEPEMTEQEKARADLQNFFTK